ncbi:zf-HC2 domain-containing protein [Fictibacillus aquaticus]|uniref:Putative zinc-finger domain-containing protein n=1 Tax=Fictibacillus aquaticus TaxID=2021314 RepID=A0A235FEW5_9BACL|nr:zf-HC2 domain-containing protein [Fictibacillus aquaticus]OYD59315.1 hypothetical protein CGZ90_05330 [Fictibacillus aquaticus]
MKHDCDVIQELQPLYEDGGLKPSVMKKIDEHLKTCQSCREYYEIGGGDLHDYFASQEEIAPTAELDQKMKLRFKLRRMKVIAALLVIVIVSSLVQDYAHSRERIIDGRNDLYRSAEFFEQMTHNVVSDDKPQINFWSDEYFGINQDVQKMEENYNWIEQKRNMDNWHVLNSDTYFQMIEVMVYRRQNNMWNDQDEKAYKEMEQHTGQFKKVVKEIDRVFYHGYSSYFELLNVKELNMFYKKMNELSYFYITYHKTPDMVKPLSQKEMKKRLQSFFQMKNADVSLEKARISSSSDVPGNYRYTIENKDHTYSGEMNAYSGYILDARNEGDLTESGKLKKEKEVRQIAEEYARRLFGDKIKYGMVYEGMNYNSSSTEDVYSYSVALSFLPYDAGHAVVIHLNAVTGELTDMTANMLNGYIKAGPEINAGIKINKADAEKQALALVEEERRQDPAKLEFYKTETILSSLTGKYVRVHIFEIEDGENFFINAETGEKEIPYTGAF